MINLEKLRKKITFFRLAKAMDIPLSTVYSWKTKIPAWRLAAIEDYCRANDIDISDCFEKEPE